MVGFTSQAVRIPRYQRPTQARRAAEGCLCRVLISAGAALECWRPPLFAFSLTIDDR